MATALAALSASLVAVYAASAGDSAQALALLPNKPVELVCQTKSVVVATNAANASTGEIRLSLVLKHAVSIPQQGAWRIVSAAGGHSGSFAAPAHRGKACAEACPLTMPDTGQIQLWSPAPKGIDQLVDNELLLLAVVKTKSLDLRASTFSGKQIEALEEGTCKVAP